MNPLKIAIIGSGAVGSYYGARLAQGGNHVHFLLRRDFAHVRDHGMIIHSCRGDFALPQVHAHETTASIGKCDLVVVALKSTGNDALPSLLPPLLDERTLVVTLQNGLGNEEFIAELVGAERVLGGVCFTCINRTAPGVIEHTAQGNIRLGEFSGPPQARTEALAAEFRRCGIECEAVPSLAAARWRKLVWNIPFNGLAILGGGITTQEILADPALAHLVRALMNEVIAAATAMGYPMPDGLIDNQFCITKAMGPYRPSSMIDYLAGHDVEVEPIWGEPWRRALAAGVPSGRLEMMYHLIKSGVAARKSRGKFEG